MDGLIEQWGYDNDGTYGKKVTLWVTYYNQNSYTVVAVRNNTRGYNDTSCTVYRETNNAFRFNTYGAECDWYAIGY